MRTTSTRIRRIALAGAMLAGASFAAGWTSPVSGGQVGPADDFQISTTPVASQSTVAYNATDDEYLAVWTQVDGSLESRVMGQLLDAHTGAPAGSEFLVAEIGSGDPTTGVLEPDVAWNSVDDEYLVVFAGDDTTTLTTTFEIYAQRVSALGALVGARARVSDMGIDDANGSFDANHPAVAHDPVSNEYLVVWDGDDEGPGLGNGQDEIFGQILAADLTEPPGVNDVRLSDMGPDGDTAFDAADPAVAFLGGAYLVAWDGDDTINALYEIYGQWVDADGAEVGADFLISTDPSNDEAYDPAVAANPDDGEMLVVWSGDDGLGNDFEIKGAIVAAGISAAGTESALSSSGDSAYNVETPSAAYQPAAGAYSVVWSGDSAGITADNEYEVFHTVVATSGAVLEPAERVSTMGTDGVLSTAVDSADIAAGPGSSSGIVWSGEDGVGVDKQVYGQLVSPSSDLAIDKVVTTALNPAPGDPVEYLITYTNNGPTDAFDVHITDLVPAGVTINAVIPTGATLVPVVGSEYEWVIASLPSGSGGTIALIGTLDANAVDGTDIVNTATISNGALGYDANLTNNSNDAILTVDAPPAVTITSAAPDPTNTSPIPVTITFSEAVSGFDVTEITVGNGSAGNLQGGPAVYTADVTPSADGTVTVDVAASVATDSSGKPNTAADQFSITYDATAPTVTIDQAAGQADPTDTGPIEFTIVFSEPVVGFGLGDIDVVSTAGAVTPVLSAVSPTSYTLSVSGMTTNGTVTASIGAGAAADAAGNPSAASTSTDNVVTFTVNTPPTLSNLSVTDVDENGVAILTGAIVDPDDGDTFTLDIDWGDGASDSYVFADITTPFAVTHQYLDDDPSGTASDDYTVSATVTDSEGADDTDTDTATVTNVAPLISNLSVTDVDEDGTATLTADLTDPGTHDTFVVTIDWGDGSTPEAFNYPAGSTSISETHHYLDDNPTGTASDDYTVSVSVADDDTGTDDDTTSVTVSNVAPEVTTSTSSTTAQYSDASPSVTITATDVADEGLDASASWSTDGVTFTAGLPAGLSLSAPSCTEDTAANTSECTWTLSGDTTLAAGTYTVRVAVTDHDGGSTDADIGIAVGPEDATVRFDPGNPVAVPVTADGSDASEPFTMTVFVRETVPDVGTGPAPGDINLAEVSVTLQPIGPGSSTTVDCTPAGPVTPFDYAAELELTCDFDGVPVNTYSVIATVSGGYYAGTAEDVVTVFDPSLGFTTGGGTYLDANGDRVNFGYTMKYNKKRTNVQGSLVVIRHTDDGVYRIKSNRIEGLALGSTTDYGWASFTGKATYQEPGWIDAIGNYDFTVYVEDHATSGAGADRFWVTANREGELAAGLAMPPPATANAAVLTGGNIVVPHQGGDRTSDKIR